ncbi:MAG: patatin-like phospholipase family protein [Cyanobacteria bacterium SZAS LIN-2]|nr:patatin-like phospholipase family protein [Cyanobacteria bacterium SZAS LIN-3]MBS1998877.1 patatin-like phospholipase family protein [Cyanobacteria bacterium SZAS LIN-2]
MCNQLCYKFAHGTDGVIELELVLGAGGVKGYLHIGLLKGLVEFCNETGTRLRITKVTGVSVGAIIATLFTNGWSWERILQLFLDAHDRAGNPLLLASAFAIPSMRSFLVGRSFLSLERPWDKFVEENKLVGNDRLRLVAADSQTHEAIVFEGQDYKLGTALSASGSLPGVFLPVGYGNRLLIDGAAYHRNPDQFCERPAIISALGFAKSMPREPLDLMSMHYHMRELFFPIVEQPTKVDEVRHMHVLHAADDVCGLSFALSKARCLQMVDDGCANIKGLLYQACRDGQIEGCNHKMAA